MFDLAPWMGICDILFKLFPGGWRTQALQYYASNECHFCFLDESSPSGVTRVEVSVDIMLPHRFYSWVYFLAFTSPWEWGAARPVRHTWLSHCSSRPYSRVLAL
jgi:hypothetical protein